MPRYNSQPMSQPAGSFCARVKLRTLRATCSSTIFPRSPPVVSTAKVVPPSCRPRAIYWLSSGEAVRTASCAPRSPCMSCGFDPRELHDACCTGEKASKEANAYFSGVHSCYCACFCGYDSSLNGMSDVLLTSSMVIGTLALRCYAFSSPRCVLYVPPSLTTSEPRFFKKWWSLRSPLRSQESAVQSSRR